MIVVKNNNVKKSASKVRQVCNLIRNKKVEDALRILRFNEKKEIAIMLTKLLNSGFRPKYGVEDAIDEIIENFNENKLEDKENFHTVKWMKKLKLDTTKG